MVTYDKHHLGSFEQWDKKSKKKKGKEIQSQTSKSESANSTHHENSNDNCCGSNQKTVSFQVTLDLVKATLKSYTTCHTYYHILFNVTPTSTGSWHHASFFWQRSRAARVNQLTLATNEIGAWKCVGLN